MDILGHLACSPRRTSSPRDIFSKAKLAAREKKRAQLNQSQPVTWSIPSPPSQHDPSISIMCNMDAAWKQILLQQELDGFSLMHIHSRLIEVPSTSCMHRLPSWRRLSRLDAPYCMNCPSTSHVAGASHILECSLLLSTGNEVHQNSSEFSQTSSLSFILLHLSDFVYP